MNTNNDKKKGKEPIFEESRDWRIPQERNWTDYILGFFLTLELGLILKYCIA